LLLLLLLLAADGGAGDSSGGRGAGCRSGGAADSACTLAIRHDRRVAGRPGEGGAVPRMIILVEVLAVPHQRRKLLIVAPRDSMKSKQREK
jgi:hypothetical protein